MRFCSGLILAPTTRYGLNCCLYRCLFGGPGQVLPATLTHPVEPLCLEDVAVDLVQLPPASGAAPVDAAVLALALHAGSRGHAGEHCKRGRRKREELRCVIGRTHFLTALPSLSSMSTALASLMSPDACKRCRWSLLL